MTPRYAIVLVLALVACSRALADQAPSATNLGSVAPALKRYTDTVLEGDLWKRPDLAPRDRSIATVSAMVATGQAGSLRPELVRALDNGVTPAELGALMTHLAFYAGWPNALSAMGVAKAVFAERGVSVALPAAPAGRIPSDEKADAPRAAGVEKAYGAISPAIVRYTNGVLFDDLWRSPDLSPRDRTHRSLWRTRSDC